MEANNAINVKPNKPDAFTGTRDFLVVHTWLYKMEQYINLTQLMNSDLTLNDANKIMFASTFLTGTASVWWFTRVQSNTVPATWAEFKGTISQEFVPADHVRRSREKFRRLKQTSSVSKYLSDFHNIVFTIPDVNEGERLDKFVDGLNHQIRLEVMKSTVNTFEDASKIALRVDSALNTFTKHPISGSSAAEGPTPMEIGNLEHRHDRRCGESQRTKDIRLNACFTCHKVGCRPWKHKTVEASVSNVELHMADGTDGECAGILSQEN